MPGGLRDHMLKRPSLFTVKSVKAAIEPPAAISAPRRSQTARPPSRVGKRVLSIYLDPLAWKQIRQLALDTETSTLRWSPWLRQFGGWAKLGSGYR